MKLNVYSVKDEVAGDHPFTFEAPNDGMMERIVKGALLSKEQNVINTNIKDKVIYLIGTRDTTTGEIKGETPIFIKRISEIRLDLIKEIKIAKAEAGEKEPTAEEVVDE